MMDYTPGQIIYEYNSPRTATVLGTDEYCVRLQWNDTKTIDRVLPECVESAQQHQQRIDAEKNKHHRQQQAEPVSVRDARRW